jgi:hypothetical protein
MEYKKELDQGIAKTTPITRPQRPLRLCASARDLRIRMGGTRAEAQRGDRDGGKCRNVRFEFCNYICRQVPNNSRIPPPKKRFAQSGYDPTHPVASSKTPPRSSAPSAGNLRIRMDDRLRPRVHPFHRLNPRPTHQWPVAHPHARRGQPRPTRRAPGMSDHRCRTVSTCPADRSSASSTTPPRHTPP